MRRGIALLLCAALPACSHGGAGKSVGTLTSNSDNVVWEAGQKLLKQKRWEEARQHFKRIVEGFPQSDHSAEARLALGDSYFSEGGEANYILAVSEYRGFLTLFPSHPRSEYAQFRVALAFDRQRHGPDRDSSNTERALEEYQRLLEIYPNTQHQEEARTRIVDCRQNLARTDFLIGFFYQKTRKAYRASLARYEIILKDYPDYARLDEVLFRTAECLRFTARFTEALPRVNQLLEDYPKSPLLEPARKLREDLVALVGASALPPTPAPPAADPAQAPPPAPSTGMPDASVSSPPPPPQP